YCFKRIVWRWFGRQGDVVVAGRTHEQAFHWPAGPGEQQRDAWQTRFERFGDGDSRVDVAGRAATGDHNFEGIRHVSNAGVGGGAENRTSVVPKIRMPQT